MRAMLKHPAFWVSVLIVSFASIPYVIGWAAEGDWIYFGVYDASPADTYAYYALIEQARQGKFLLDNTFTFSMQQSLLFHPLWLALGWIAAFLNISTIAIYHIARVVFGVGLLLTVYRLTAWVSLKTHTRLLLLVLAGLSGGFSWMMTPLFLGAGWAREAMFHLLPSDAWITESNTYMTLLHTPLFMASQILMIGILYGYWRNLIDPQPRRTWQIMAGLALLAIIHPYDVVIVFGVMFVHAVAFGIPWTTEWKPRAMRLLKQLFVYGLACAPAAIYLLWAFSVEPSLSGWAEQNITESPPVSSYLFGFGFLWIGLVAFAVDAWQRGIRRQELGLLIAWLIAAALLIYAPSDVNRRFSHGVGIPFSLLSGHGFLLLARSLKDRFKIGYQHLVVPILSALVVLSGTAIYSTMRASDIAVRKPEVFALPGEFAEAAIWARKNTEQDARFFIHPSFGAHWTALSGRPVYIGHGHQTPEYEKTLNTVIQHWIHGSVQQQEQLLYEIQPDYIVVTETEKELVNVRVFENQLFPVVFENDLLRIYRYVPGASSTSEIDMRNSELR